MADVKRRRKHNDVAPLGAAVPEEVEADALLTEHATMIREDEEEVHDLGFIVEDHDEAHARHLGEWQRLDTLDTDEALETDPDAPLPAEADALERIAVPLEAHEVDFRVTNLAAEREAMEFAEANQLVADPYDEGLTTVLGDADGLAADLDDDQRPDRVNLLGRAPGISAGFGSRVAQDIGPEGFEIRDNPLVVPAGELDYPVSTEPVSDEALGRRDVDEMGSEEDLDRLADRGARLEERSSRRQRRSGRG